MNIKMRFPLLYREEVNKKLLELSRKYEKRLIKPKRYSINELLSDKESAFSLREFIQRAIRFYWDTLVEIMRSEVYNLLDNTEQIYMYEICKFWLFFQLFECAIPLIRWEKQWWEKHLAEGYLPLP